MRVVTDPVGLDRPHRGRPTLARADGLAAYADLLQDYPRASGMLRQGVATVAGAAG